MLALLRLPRPPLARSSRVPPSPLRPPPARLAALPATVPGWVGPLSGGGGVRVLDLPLPPTGMLAALGLAIRRPSPPSPPFAPDRSLSPPFAARAVLHAFIQSRASGHGLCAPSPLMGIASVTSQITPRAGRPAVPPSFRSLRACRSGRHAPTLPPVTRRCLRFCACPVLPLPGLPACRLHLCGPRPPAWPLSQLLCRGGWARFLVVVVCGSSTCPSPPLVCLPPLGWPSGAPRLPPRPLRPTAP